MAQYAQRASVAFHTQVSARSTGALSNTAAVIIWGSIQEAHSLLKPRCASLSLVVLQEPRHPKRRRLRPVCEEERHHRAHPKVRPGRDRLLRQEGKRNNKPRF